MTARNPLYYDSGNLVEMSTAELLKWQQQDPFINIHKVNQL